MGEAGGVVWVKGGVNGKDGDKGELGLGKEESFGRHFGYWKLQVR